MYKLSLLFGHPCCEETGHKPVDLSSAYTFEKEQEKTGLLMELLVYCPDVYKLLLDAYERGKSQYMRKLLPGLPSTTAARRVS